MIFELKMIPKEIQNRFPFVGEPILNQIWMVLTLYLFCSGILGYISYIIGLGVWPSYSQAKKNSHFLIIHMTSDLKMSYRTALKRFPKDWN